MEAWPFTAHSKCISLPWIQMHNMHRLQKNSFSVRMFICTAQTCSIHTIHNMHIQSYFHTKQKQHSGTHSCPYALKKRHTKLWLHIRKQLCHSLSFYSHLLQCHCYDTPVITLPDVSCWQTAFWLMCTSYFLEALQAGYRPTDIAQFHRLSNKAASCWQIFFYFFKTKFTWAGWICWD